VATVLFGRFFGRGSADLRLELRDLCGNGAQMPCNRALGEIYSAVAFDLHCCHEASDIS